MLKGIRVSSVRSFGRSVGRSVVKIDGGCGLGGEKEKE